MNVNFNTTPEDSENINTIVNMAINTTEYPVDKMSLEMDITAVHLNDCPLDLEKLMWFDEFNFMHDVAGIQSHIDRNTGKLKDHFLPRCSV